MKHRISNSHLSVEVLEKGAELCSFFDHDHGLELLWQADPKAWPRHAPILFPIVGRLVNDTYKLNGTSYRLTQHGFARDMTFELEEKSDQHIVMSLRQSPETLAMYPFAFHLRVSYLLIDSRLRVTYAVENPGTEPMWFSIGAHPAFHCPIEPGKEGYEDYELRFERAETKVTHLITGGLFDGQTEPMLNGQDHIPVSHELFAKDALVFHQLSSAWVALQSRVTGRGVKLHSPNWPYYGIWAKTNGDFVCLEPWYGRADDTTANGDLTQKTGIIRLEGGSTWSAHHDVEAM
ncbi:MAG: aldose 1-epimerase family protein [Bacteroidia bacterium]|nr:aldose 1-epimerase family protein [Bacteroidia bacterium]